MCGAIRDQAVRDHSWDKICQACGQYARKFGVARNEMIEETRQAVTAVRDLEAAGNSAECHNCGRVLDGKSGSASTRKISKVDSKTRCRDCGLHFNSKKEERPWYSWDGKEAFAALYSAIF